MTNVSNRIVTYVYEVNCPADDPAKGPRALGKLVATAQAVDYEWEAVHGIETKAWWRTQCVENTSRKSLIYRFDLRATNGKVLLR
jgi:hypothetical protein